MENPRTERKDRRRAVGGRSPILRVDDETYERLRLYALRRKCTVSELIEDYSRTELPPSRMM